MRVVYRERQLVPSVTPVLGMSLLRSHIGSQHQLPASTLRDSLVKFGDWNFFDKTTPIIPIFLNFLFRF
jgi:hypothetical protein